MHYLQRSRLLLLLSSCVLLLLLGSACGSATATNKHTVQPSKQMITHQGDGYSLSYPANWRFNKGDSKNGIGDIIADENDHFISITVSKSKPGVTAEAALAAAYKAYNGKQAVAIAHSRTIAGVMWLQKAKIADLMGDGKKSEVVVLATHYPDQSFLPNVYVLTYGGPLYGFDKLESSIFQPILQTLQLRSS